LLIKQKNNLKSLVMPMVMNHAMLQKQGPTIGTQHIVLSGKPHE